MLCGREFLFMEVWDDGWMPLADEIVLAKLPCNSKCNWMVSPLHDTVPLWMRVPNYR